MNSIFLNKKIIKIVSFTLIFLTIFMFSVVFATDDSIYVWSTETEPLTTETSSTVKGTDETSGSGNTTTTKTNTDVNTEDKANSNTLNLESGGAVLIEQTTGQVLYDHNMHEKLRPASVTKVMSILLIMEAIDSGQISLQDKVPCSENAAGMGGSQIWLEVGEELFV